MDIGARCDDDFEQLARAIAVVRFMGILQNSVPVDVGQIANPGSDLAVLIDELPDPPVDPRLTISYGLSGSYGCLAQVSDLLNPKHETFPVVLQTLIRTALLGASRIIFMLGPECHEERLANMTIVLAQEGKSLNRALGSFSKFSALYGLMPPARFVNTAHERHKALGVKNILTETQMLRRMSEVVAGSLKDYDAEPVRALSEHIEWLFNTLSGVAHGFGWPRLLPGTESMSGNFIADFSTAASIGHLAAHLVLNRGGHPIPSAE